MSKCQQLYLSKKNLSTILSLPNLKKYSTLINQRQVKTLFFQSLFFGTEYKIKIYLKRFLNYTIIK